MRAAARFMIASALAVPGLLVANLATAQTNPAATFIGNITDRYADTPSNRGLIPTAVAEAGVATDHAGMASEARDNLGTMKLHAGHVIYCIDPTLEESGPCLGYGIKKANLAAIKEMEQAAAAPGASASVRILSKHILAALKNSIAIADQVVITAKKIQATTDVGTAADLADLLAVMTAQIQAGWDKNEDGKIAVEESAINQANQRLTLLKRAEGIGAIGGTTP